MKPYFHKLKCKTPIVVTSSSKLAKVRSEHSIKKAVEIIMNYTKNKFTQLYSLL